MGYPMTWRRVVHRNGALGGYDGVAGNDAIGAPQWSNMDPERFREHPRVPHRESPKSMLAGDMRRVEADQRDERHLAEYARRAGVTPEQAKAVIDAFLEGDF